MSVLDTPTRQFIDRGRGGAKIPHMPGLDGLRGLAVAGVVAFHSDHAIAVGGYLGVSTFFTLSGFLITSLILAESRSAGSVDLRGFWVRRFRRLLPASTATLLLVIAFGFTVATASQRLALRGDVLASLFQVANWRYVLAGTSYGDLFAAPSPVLHFWSLAIEEQFYWLFPPFLVGVIALTRGARGRVLSVLLALTAASFVLPLVFDMSTDRVYFGTDTRAAELLLGAALAVVMSHRELRRRMALRYRWRTVVLLVGAACLAVQLVWWFTVEQGTSWLYRGGLGLYAVMTCAVIAAVALPTGMLRQVFSNRPLRYLGERSYGIYLIHWPIFLVLRQELGEQPALLRTVIGVGATLVIAELSYRMLEQPIRTGAWPAKGRGRRLAVPAFAAVVALALLPIPVRDSERPIDFEAALREFEQPRRPSGSAPGSSTTTTVPPDSGLGAPPDSTPEPPRAPEPRVATFGDSTALLMGIGMEHYLYAAGLGPGVPGGVELGCPVSRFAELRLDKVWPVADQCRAWPEQWAASLQQERPDVAQLITGVWEVADAKLPGASEFSAVGSPEVDAFVEREMLTAVDTLSSTGAMVVIVLWPASSPGREADAVGHGEVPPERMQRFHELQRKVAAARPDTTRVVDLEAWLGDRAEDLAWRPDGVHIQAERAAEVYREWLAPEIDRLWQEWWVQHRYAPAQGPSGG